MKSRILALLLCVVLVLTACLMTACEMGNNNENKVTEVTDDEARQTALTSFFKGVDAIRKSGVTCTGSLKGSETETDEEGVQETEEFDLTLSFTYNDEKFVAAMDGTIDGKAGMGEVYFDGTLIGMLEKSGEDQKESFDVVFLDDVAGSVPAVNTLPTGEDADYTEILDKVAALIDYDKFANNVAKATKDFITVEKKGKTYILSVSSDKLFDAALGLLNTVKTSGDLKISQLIDALCGEGTYDALMTELESVAGTDTFETLLPKLEKFASDLGLKVNAIYDFVAPMIVGEDATGDDLRDFLLEQYGEMTVDDAISMVMMMTVFSGKPNDGYYYDEFDEFDEFDEYDEYDEYDDDEPLQMDEPGATGAGDDAMTYEDLITMIRQYADMKVNELGEMFEIPEFDIATMIAPAISYAEAFKEAIKFNLSVTCDNKLNPTAISLTASVDTTKLPEDLDLGIVLKFTLTINAEIKDAVAVTPSEAMAAKIADAKSEREAGPEEE